MGGVSITLTQKERESCRARHAATAALARLAALALLTTAAVRKPAEAQTAIPVTSPGMATAPELVAAFAGAGAAAGTAPTAFAYTFEVVLL